MWVPQKDKPRMLKYFFHKVLHNSKSKTLFLVLKECNSQIYSSCLIMS